MLCVIGLAICLVCAIAVVAIMRMYGITDFLAQEFKTDLYEE